MAGWLALSDLGTPLEGAEGISLLTRAALVLEFELPLEGATVLLDFKANENWPRSLSIFVDDAAGVVVLHRQGDRLVRHALPGPLQLASNGVGRITFGWDGPAKSWTLALDHPGHGHGRQTRGHSPMPMQMEDVLAICDGLNSTIRHRSVLWFGVMKGDNLPKRSAWVGLQTPMDTISGPRTAGSLRAGDLLLTDEGDYTALLATRIMDVPSRGSFSPVMLRAPYFGTETDILVSSDQLVALSGDEVDYLFGEDTVLTEARHLTDGRAALMDYRRAVTRTISLYVGAARILRAEDCRLLSHVPASGVHGQDATHRILMGYETIPLLDMLGRTGTRRAA